MFEFSLRQRLHDLKFTPTRTTIGLIINPNYPLVCFAGAQCSIKKSKKNVAEELQFSGEKKATIIGRRGYRTGLV